MNAARKAITFLFLFSMILAACAPGQSSESAIQTGIAQTLQIAQLETAAAGGGQQQATSGPANTAAPTEIPSATLTATPSIPTTTVTQDTNCRTGPSVFYAFVTLIDAGEVVEVLKVFSSSYVVIRNPSGAGDCWLWLQYATNTNFSAYNLPQATQPPTPLPTATATPAFNWEGDWNITVKNATNTYTGSMDCNVTGNNISCDGVINGGLWPYNWSGTVSASLQNAGGTFSGTGSGDWDAQIKSGNLNQFVGNLDAGTWEFCGARSGSSTPDPCLWP